MLICNSCPIELDLSYIEFSLLYCLSGCEEPVDQCPQLNKECLSYQVTFKIMTLNKLLSTSFWPVISFHDMTFRIHRISRIKTDLI